MPTLPADIKTKIKGALTSMWADPRKNAALTEQQIQQGLFWEWGQNSSNAVLGESGFKAQSDFVSHILSVETYRAVFSEAEVERYSIDSLFEVLSSAPLSIDHDADIAIANLEVKLAQPPIEWDLMFPIANLRVDAPGYEMGKVSFYPPTSIDTFIERARTILRPAPFRTESSMRDHFDRFAIANVQVTAVDRIQAEFLGEQHVSDSLFALRLLFADLYRNKGLYTDIQGTIPAGVRSYWFMSSKGVLSASTRFGPKQPLPISGSRVTQPAAINLTTLLSKESSLRSELERRLVSALRLFGHSMNLALDEDAFVGVVSSVEALLLDDRTPRNEGVAERTAHILGGTGPQKKQVYDEMKRLYRVRSDLVHGIEVDFSPTDLLTLTAITQRVFASTLNMIPAMPNDGDIARWFEKMKFQ
jgi:hypothetical protein